MSDHEILREPLDEMPDEEHLETRRAEGWRLSALEWRRPRTGASDPSDETEAEPPYGLRLEPETARLEPSVGEERALRMMLKLVIDDRNSLDDVATALNREGLSTRAGRPWNAREVFQLLPRLVEVAPGIYRSRDWAR